MTDKKPVDLESIPKEVIELIVNGIIAAGVDYSDQNSLPSVSKDSNIGAWVEEFGLQKKQQYSGTLALEMTAQGITLANKNSLRLLADAEILYAAKSYPSSLSLAVLAIEEMGKHIVLNGLVTLDEGNKTSPIWKQYRNHRSKNILCKLPLIVANDGKSVSNVVLKLLFDNSSHSEELDWLKQVGFYTDCVGDGEWQSPDSITAELASSIIEIAKKLSVNLSVSEEEVMAGLRKLHSVFSSGTPEEKILKAVEYLKDVRGSLPP